MRYNADLTIDLHGLTAEAAVAYLCRRLEPGYHSKKSVLVIHGNGAGRLREAVRAWARRSALVEDIWEGENRFLDGGSGVTLLFLR
ncbi:MAG: Smr/MutS family protein [Thermoguttaceae bacterium]|nr:Smr/MutS family protein [Thermoguttaceae bacterium]